MAVMIPPVPRDFTPNSREGLKDACGEFLPRYTSVHLLKKSKLLSTKSQHLLKRIIMII